MSAADYAIGLLHLPRLIREQQQGMKRAIRKATTVLQAEGLRGVVSLLRHARALATPVPDHAVAAPDCTDYPTWIREQEALQAVSSLQVAKDIQSWDQQPLISVIMPVFNPEPVWLEEAVRSLQGQVYPHWELCAADDCSTSATIRPLLQRLAETDPRIRIVFRSRNGHISEASNSAIELAAGTWMALMDQDDLLAPDALYHVAKAIRAHPQAELIYSDEDKIEEGRRFDPYFKPDWNPDLIRSQNMISHLGVYRLERVRQIGGFRKGFEGSQDHDLALRFTEGLAPAAIVHVPRILYHWRSHRDSTARSGSNKSYAVTAGKRAIDEHLLRLGASGTTEIIGSGMYRVRYNLPEPAPAVSIIIRVGERLHLRRCVGSVLDRTDYPQFDIVLMGDIRRDDAFVTEIERAYPGRRIAVAPMQGGIAGRTSRVPQGANGTFLCFLDGAMEVIDREWLRNLVALAAQNGVGAAGARLWYPNDRLFHAGYVLGVLGLAGHAHRFLPFGRYGHGGRAGLIQTMTAVSSDCLVVQRVHYEKSGGFDPALPPGFAADIDLCLRLRRQGFRIVWTPFANLYHHSAKYIRHPHGDLSEESCESMYRILLARWGSQVESDPAYNRNLTRDHEDFSLAWGARLG